ncbi:MAG TPA: hypothetical protein VL970_15455, partial [Candidatus Acidoferrales bacterium]|nr:hypothetical protein [Candidatus Acidoferrales bacterium]
PPASITNMADAMMWTFDQKAQALESLLTPAQLDLYHQQQATQTKLMQNMMDKMGLSGGGK